MKDEWTQSQIIHCPDPKCTGMLLQNPYCHTNKCSTCKKLWLSKIDWIEVDEIL